MKTTWVWTLILFAFSLFILLPHTAAVDTTKWGLPEGAKLRIGKGYIYGMAYSADGTKLAVRSSVGVRLYDAETGEALDLLTPDEQVPSSVAFSPNASILALGIGREIRLLDVETGSLLRTLTGHTEQVDDSIAFSPDGTTLASGSYDRTIRVWDVNTGKELAQLSGYIPLVPSIHGGRLAFSADGVMIASGIGHGTIRVWDAETGSLLRTLTGHTSAVGSVAFSPHGTTLASGSYDDTVRVWDAETGSLLRTLTGHMSSVTGVAFSPDGNIIASASDNAAVRLWDAETGEVVWPPYPTGGYVNFFNVPEGYAYGVTFSPDGGTLAIRGWYSTIHLWDLDTGSLVTSSTDISGGRFIRIIPDADSSPRTLIDHSPLGGEKIVFSPDGTLLAELGTKKIIFSPDGTLLEESGAGRGTVVLRDAKTGNYLRSFTPPTNVEAIAFSPDGTLLALGSRGAGTLYLWDLRTDELQVLGKHEHYINSVAFSPDGTLIASAGYHDHSVHLWDVETGSLRHTLRVDYLLGSESVAFSPDSTMIALTDGKDAVLWDVKTGQSLRRFTGHSHFVKSVAFRPDGNTLATGSVDSTARVWDVQTGKELALLTGTGNTWAGFGVLVAFSPDGDFLATGGEHDDSVHLWYVGMWNKFKTFKGAGHVRDIAFSPDGSTLATIRDADSVIIFWEVVPTPTPDADEFPQLSADVNGDGEVNIQDLVAVAAALGEVGENAADVNGDGEVNIQDLVAVAAAIGEVAAAPAVLRQQGAAHLTQEDVQHWITQAQQANLTDATSVRGIRFLAQLLAAFTPKETALLANYPNPFNPETWIPYQLATPADVTLTIYDIQGRVVRDLDLGHQRAGMYQSKSRAAYWDGRNAQGESVVSGVYFYTLTAGEFTATRKMLIAK
ncbi:MAG: T9SS type A sorting domain-containing protein [Candidatus Poribacteria bacterium]|nr:T9SS type A sorting domain-containing protein [Candidatus Poribacteria bacterium]